MTKARAPLAVTRAGVGLAVRALPELDDRLRYRAEFLADLYELGPAAQLRYLTGVLSQTLALRAALGAAPAGVEEDAMTITRTRRPLRCRILHLHRWATRSTEDGGRYVTCVRCGQDQNDWLGGPGAMGAVGGG